MLIYLVAKILTKEIYSYYKKYKQIENNNTKYIKHKYRK
jgi:hypothetical protein